MAMNKKMKVLFINLAAFSLTGGIEKFNKCFLKALWDLYQQDDLDVASFSLYDQQTDANYFPQELYKGFNRSKISFVIRSVRQSRDFDVIVLGHINLAIIGLFISFLYPKKKIILIAHGIEVWKPLRGIQKSLLHKVDKIFAVSNFTKDKLCRIQNIRGNKIIIFPNTIDPFFEVPPDFNAPLYLKTRYGITEDDFVLYTLTRLSGVEQYKGYDIVIKCLPSLKEKIPNIRYILAGKYDKEEKLRVEKLVNELGLADVVHLSGFLRDEEICDHYQLGDIFIMPSHGEGFGIVYIEAAVCGARIIAGNKDGSVDALKNGELGMLVDPNSNQEISEAVFKSYAERSEWNYADKKGLQNKTLNYFGFNVFKNHLQKELLEI